MKYCLLLFTVLYMLGNAPFNSFHRSKANKYPFLIKKKSLSIEHHTLLNSFILGDKSKISKEHKKTLKAYGLMHILTPSGLHLGAILLLVTIIPFLEIPFLFFCFIFLQYFDQYSSMERVVAFRIIHKLFAKFLKTRNIELTFIMTIIFSILIGHLSKNYLSFVYSLAFWGTIIIFRDNKIRLILALNLTLHLIASFTLAKISFLSLVFNPLVTYIFTLIYPILFGFTLIHSYLFDSSIILSQLLNFFELVLNSLGVINILPLFQFEFSALALACGFLIFGYKKLFILLLCLQCTALNLEKKGTSRKSILNLPHNEEILELGNSRIIYLGKICKRKAFQIYCKKRPSHLGGPSF